MDSHRAIALHTLTAKPQASVIIVTSPTILLRTVLCQLGYLAQVVSLLREQRGAALVLLTPGQSVGLAIRQP